jgi:hypothetical protein
MVSIRLATCCCDVKYFTLILTATTQADNGEQISVLSTLQTLFGFPRQAWLSTWLLLSGLLWFDCWFRSGF